MNIEQLRRSLKIKWLTYYRDNRKWLTRLGVWVNCEGQRRPSSSFIMATLSILEPQLTQMLPLIVDLNNNPDRIISVLGLNFNPDTELKAMEAELIAAEKAVKYLPGNPREAIEMIEMAASDLASPAATDEACRGVKPFPDS